MGSVAQETRGIDIAALTAPSAQVERYMVEYLDQRALPGNLREAAKYALLGGGKRLRPVLVVRACEAVGGSIEQALPPAAAIEMIHAFSLVHDDLPAMDDDDLRRGRPTLHRHTSEAMAILAGDLLTSMAFEVVASRVSPGSLAAVIARELSAATSDMIAGQVYDTLPDFDPRMPPLQRLATIHRHKTGALIRCACRMGALVGGVGLASKELAAITAHAEAIGLMFQIVDDLLDVTQTTEHLGKATQKDAEHGKMTYPGLLGIEKSRAEVQRLRGEALGALESFGQSAQPLRDLCDYMAVRTK